MILCRQCAAPTDTWVYPKAIRQDGDVRCHACAGDRGPFYYCTTPVSCRWCRGVDPNVMLHGNNHGAAMGYRLGHCMAQHLRRNHLRYAVARDDADQVRKYLDLFLELWQHMPESEWADAVAEARHRIAALERPVIAPEHHEVHIGDQLDLFGGAA